MAPNWPVARIRQSQIHHGPDCELRLVVKLDNGRLVLVECLAYLTAFPEHPPQQKSEFTRDGHRQRLLPEYVTQDPHDRLEKFALRRSAEEGGFSELAREPGPPLCGML